MNNELASNICQNEYTISKNIFLKIWNHLDKNEKNTIFLKHYKLLNNENIERCFLDLNGFYPNFSDRTRRHKVEIEYDNNVINLIKYLKESEYITSYQIIDNNKK